MEKLLKVKRNRLTLAISSLVLLPVSAFGVVLFSLKLLYIPLLTCILLTAYAVYGCPFYFLAYADAKLCVKIFRVLAKEQTYSVAAIATAVGIKEDFARKLIEKTIRKKYITGFLLDGEKVIKEQ